MIGQLRSAAGLARSLAIYRARPWRIAQLAQLYSGLVGPGDLAFDIGAHVGNRSWALLRAGARVVALEPQPLFAAFLRRDLPAGVTLLPLAAGPAAGPATLAVSRLHPTVSSLAAGFPGRMQETRGFRAVRWDHAEPVAMTTLDALIADHGLPKFIKIDVEGFETQVLAGLSRPVPWIAFECLPGGGEATHTALERIAALGSYRFNLVVGEHAGFELPEWRDAAGISEASSQLRDPGDIYARREGTDGQ